jgi:hypothetical protein
MEWRLIDFVGMPMKKKKTQIDIYHTQEGIGQKPEGQVEGQQ